MLLPNIIRVISLRSVKLEGHVSCIGEELNTHEALVGKTEVKKIHF